MKAEGKEPPEDLGVRTKRFALRVIALVRALPKNEVPRVLGRQVLRSGTSVGANYREVQRSRSKPEFAAKIGDCLKEVEETGYELGYNLLEKHAEAGAAQDEDVLTGPALTALVANLALKPVDMVMEKLLAGGYFRYVDDFALMGDGRKVTEAESVLGEQLAGLGLDLHPNKRFSVPAQRWVEGKCDFSRDDESPSSWKVFVGSIRQLLLREPARMTELRSRFRDAGIRIVPLDYATVVTEQSYVSRMIHFWRSRAWRQKVRALSIPEIVGLGRELRLRYRETFESVISDAGGLQGYDRKRRIHTLRHCAARLIYLEEGNRVGDMAVEMGRIKEMQLYAAVLDAIARRDVSLLVEYGVNAAQAAAQPLKALEAPLRCSRQHWPEVALQGRAVLLAHGLTLDEQGSAPVGAHPMTTFCAWADGAGALVSEPNSFFGRLACLHGPEDGRRHSEVLGSAFDVDDNLLFELDYLMQQSS